MSFLKAMVLFGVYVLCGNDCHPTFTLFLILEFVLYP